MAKSEAFARIKDQVLRIVAVIPESKITTYPSIGEHLAVMPRQGRPAVTRTPIQKVLGH